MPRRSVTLTGLLALGLMTGCTSAPVPGVARGHALYSTCAACHGNNGAGNPNLGAPAIGGLPAWYVQAQLVNFQSAHRGYDAFDTNGIRMKSVSWTLDREGDDSSVAAYNATLNPGPTAASIQGDTAAGRVTFQICSACHGPNAAGNPEVHAPPLAGRSDWYLYGQLRKFKAGARGAHPADIWGATMRAQAMALDSSAMINVLSFIHTLRQEPAAR